jgi:signal peptidase I
MIRKLYDWSSSWTGTIVIVLSVIFFVAQAFVIPSGSMKNSLLIGDMLFVKKFAYGIPTPTIPWINIKVLPDFNDNGHLIEGPRPKRGDIVVFLYPGNPNIHYVKRNIAVGGDLVALRDKHLLLHPHEGNEYVKENYPEKQIVKCDDKLWIVDPYRKDHPGIHNDPSVINNGMYQSKLFNMMPLEIPKDEFFMMGDNRDHSNDSRFWGTVPYKLIIGTPWIIYFSWDKDKSIRWDRLFRTPSSLEKDMHGKEIKINHEKGIY